MNTRIASVESSHAAPLAAALVVVPTYNERDNILELLDAIRTLPIPFDICVVDDGSPDGTADIIRSRMATFPTRVILMRRTGKHGLGTAYLDAFHWIQTCAPGYEAIIQMDADFSHDPCMLPALFRAAETHGVAVGSRYVAGGSTPDWNRWRLLISRLGNIYARAILRMRLVNFTVRDATAGFTAYRMDALQTIVQQPIFGDGYAYQVSMKYVALRMGYPPTEIPIVFRDRKVGISKIDRRIIREALAVPWKLLFRWKPISRL